MKCTATDRGWSADAVVVATSKQISCDLGEDTAILNLKNSTYYGLNPLGADIWRFVQQPRTLREIRDAILREYEVKPARLEADLERLFQDLHREGLIEVL